MNAVFVHDATTASQAMKHVRQRIKSGLEDFSLLIHRLEIERGTTALYLSSKSDEIYQDLQDTYIFTDKSLANILHWNPSDIDGQSQATPQYFESQETFLRYIESFRTHLNPNTTTLYEEMTFYTNVIDLIKRRLSDFQIATSQGIWPKLVSYELLVQAKGHAGVKRALGSTFYATGGFYNHSMYEWFLEKSIYGDALLEISMYYTPKVEDVYYDLLQLDINLSNNLQEMENEIKLNQYDIVKPSWEKGDEWFRRMTKLIDFLLITQNTLAGDIMTELDLAIEALQKEYIIAVVILAVVVLISPVIIHLIFKQTKHIQQIGGVLHMRTIQLEEERIRAETLLNRLLPPIVAEQLKQEGTALAEFYEDATIFFSDMVNFTQSCTQSSPLQVVEMLNVLYHALDALIEKFDAYKVETIGDAYMVASGIPTPNGRQHAVEIALMSLAIRHSLGNLNIPHMPDQRYVLRIGIHTGACAAGVVGKTMPRYCLFGDTVNTASRMESTGEADRIHVSEATRQALESNLDYGPKLRVKLRGIIHVKGKGDMTTYWLDSKEPSLAFIGRGVSFEEKPR
ncbi:uncharacterized protein [Amphiura filiformis]|uniref:uncharacterized protein n=1 Tax=Amphiura filiformis TaxID=82378 RepID=UPI003B227718